jgi:hypothetical protein
LIFNQYDDRPKSFVDFEKNVLKAGATAPGYQADVHRAGVAGKHPIFAPKDVTGHKAHENNRQKELAGATNGVEKWWNNEGANCRVSQQGGRN